MGKQNLNKKNFIKLSCIPFERKFAEPNQENVVHISKEDHVNKVVNPIDTYVSVFMFCKMFAYQFLQISK